MPVTSVDSAASDTQLLAPKSGRRGASIRNTDANILYVVLDGSAASTTNHTVALSTGDYYETPHFYRGGEIRGIWAGNGSGAALIFTDIL